MPTVFYFYFSLWVVFIALHTWASSWLIQGVKGLWNLVPEAVQGEKSSCDTFSTSSWDLRGFGFRAVRALGLIFTLIPNHRAWQRDLFVSMLSRAEERREGTKYLRACLQIGLCVHWLTRWGISNPELDLRYFPFSSDSRFQTDTNTESQWKRESNHPRNLKIPTHW